MVASSRRDSAGRTALGEGNEVEMMWNRVVTVVAVVGGLTVGAVATPTAPASAAVSAVVPARVLDTRSGIGGVVGPVGAGNVVRVAVPAALAAGATSVALNLTATDASDQGYVTAWPCDEAKPATSNLNYVPGRSVPNMAIVRLGQTGASRGLVCLEASTPVQLIADVMGWFTGTADVTPTSPNRVIDTRLSGDPVQAGVVRRVRIGGTPGVPATAAAAALNITVALPQRGGFLTAYPCASANNSGSSPTASTMNFQAGDTVASFTMTALTGGDVCIFSDSATQLIVDTFGWLPAPSSGGIAVKDPERVLDTRNGIWSTGPARSGEVVRVRVAGRGGVPNESAAALLTVTVTDARSSGYVTAWSCDGAQPNASVLNFWPGAVRANSVLVAVSASSGEVCLYSQSSDGSSVNLLADAVGWVPGTFSRPPVPAPPAPPAGRFTTLPVGAALPTGAQCAARVRPAGEVRAVNQPYNATRGTVANTAYPRVDGNFTGTTDEILQWAACKWGIDEDVVRAQIAKESWWMMTSVGDNGESFGLGQVRVPFHGSAFVDDNAKRSAAYNVDYTYAVWRSCYEGELTWLNTVERGATYAAGDLKGCLGVWFSGRWYVDGARHYIADVDDYLARRIWENPDFING
jgi:hypothetical protein